MGCTPGMGDNRFRVRRAEGWQPGVRWSAAPASDVFQGVILDHVTVLQGTWRGVLTQRGGWALAADCQPSTSYSR